MKLDKYIEESLLKGADVLIEKAESQGEKALYNLFKSAILKKYKDQYDIEVLQGEVKKEMIDKSIYFLFEDACVSFRALSTIEDSAKEDGIKHAQASLGFWKEMTIEILVNKGIKVV